VLTDESILGVPATEPLVPVVAPVVELLVLQGKGFWRVTTGDPPMFGRFGRQAAFGLLGLTAPGIGDCVRCRFAVPDIVPVFAVPGICPTVPGRDWPGAGFAGVTPGGADPGDSDGAVAVPVGLPLIPGETPTDGDAAPGEGAGVPGDGDATPGVGDEMPDDAPDEPVDELPDEPVPCPYAETLTSAANPAARNSFCDIALSLKRAFLNVTPTCGLSVSSG